MKYLHLGCNFTDEHVDAIETLVKYSKDSSSDTTVGRVYGSPPYINPFGSTRPEKREKAWAPDGYSIDMFKKATSRLQAIGVKVNLTFNMMFPHIRDADNRMAENLFDSKDAQRIFRKFFEDTAGCIDAVIVANPLVLDFIHNQIPEEHIPECIVSTIMNVTELAQVQWIKETWDRVESICPGLWMNHDLDWLREANKILPLEPLVNEFCSIGGASCDGLYRSTCYLNQNLEVKGANTMSRCVSERHNKPLAWIKGRYILPHWLKEYEEYTGIKTYKVTGRTHAAKYVVETGKRYIDEYFSGNMTSLWGQLQATNDPKNWDKKQEAQVSRMEIPVELIVPLIEHIKEKGSCDQKTCGLSCSFREAIAEKVVQHNNNMYENSL